MWGHGAIYLHPAGVNLPQDSRDRFPFDPPTPPLAILGPITCLKTGFPTHSRLKAGLRRRSHLSLDSEIRSRSTRLDDSAPRRSVDSEALHGTRHAGHAGARAAAEL